MKNLVAVLIVAAVAAVLVVNAQNAIIISVTNGVSAPGAQWGPMQRCFSP